MGKFYYQDKEGNIKVSSDSRQSKDDKAITEVVVEEIKKSPATVFKTINGSPIVGPGNIVIASGAKGDKGDKGEQGPKGDKGDKGEPGEKGEGSKLFEVALDYTPRVTARDEEKLQALFEALHEALGEKEKLAAQCDFAAMLANDHALFRRQASLEYSELDGEKILMVAIDGSVVEARQNAKGAYSKTWDGWNMQLSGVGMNVSLDSLTSFSAPDGNTAYKLELTDSEGRFAGIEDFTFGLSEAFEAASGGNTDDIGYAAEDAFAMLTKQHTWRLKVSTDTIPATEYSVDADFTADAIKVLSTGASLPIAVNGEAITADEPSMEFGLEMDEWRTPAKPRRCVILTLDNTTYALYGADGVSGSVVAIERAGILQTKKELCEDNEQLRQAIDVVILGQEPGEQYIVPGLLQMSAEKGGLIGPGLLGGPKPGSSTVTAYLFAIDTAFGKVTISVTTLGSTVTVDWSEFKGLSATGGSSDSSSGDVILDDADLQRALVDVCNENAGNDTYTLNTPNDEKHYDFCSSYFSSSYTNGLTKAVGDLQAAYSSGELNDADLFAKKMLVRVGLTYAELSGFHRISSSLYDGGSKYDMFCCSIRLSCGSYENLGGIDECVSGKLDAKLAVKFYNRTAESVIYPKVSLIVGEGDVCALRRLPAVALEE